MSRNILRDRVVVLGRLAASLTRGEGALLVEEVDLVVELVGEETTVEVMLLNMEVLGLDPEDSLVMEAENVGRVRGAWALARQVLETGELWERVVERRQRWG